MQLKFKLLFFFSILLTSAVAFGQKIESPIIVLSGIPFDIKITELPSNLDTVEIEILSETESRSLAVEVSNSQADTLITISESGKYRVKLGAGLTAESSIRAIPAWTSIIPPLLAILLALIIRQVIVALAAGIYIGAFLIFDYNPFTALLRFADTLIFRSVADPDHIYIILFTLLIGGVVGIISSNGGTIGLASKITEYAKTARSGMLSSWMMGVVVFFDDYANSLIIGNMMRPLTDKLRVSREKLSYIVDSTAAPVASIFVVSTWIGYEVGLINDGLKVVGSDANAYDVFLSSIPFSFYPLAAIFFVFLTSYLQRDFGPMYKAEFRARTTGQVSDPNSKIQEFNKSIKEFEHHEANWLYGLVPILIILIGTIVGLYFTGFNKITEMGLNDYSIQEIINHSDSYSALLWSSFIACIAAIVMSVSGKKLNLEESLDAWQKGAQTMLVAVIILVLAWSISSVTAQMKTADYLISILSDSINPAFLPALVFLVCALTGFSTGTSWGTMAIVMPIVIPLGHKMVVASGLSADVDHYILLGVVSSVLAGSVFGDHCSPIADTTILSSLASRCNHIDHVNTQLPYAILVGAVSMILGYLPIGFGISPYISLILILGSLTAIMIFFGKRLPDGR